MEVVRLKEARPELLLSEVVRHVLTVLLLHCNQQTGPNTLSPRLNTDGTHEGLCPVLTIASLSMVFTGRGAAMFLTCWVCSEDGLDDVRRQVVPQAVAAVCLRSDIGL